MDLKNKKINVLGDSITEGVGASSNETCFVSVLQKLSGATVRNYGISGTRIAKQHTPSAKERWDQDFLGRVEAMEDDADFVLVFGGTNDFGHGDSELGTFDSRDEYTFYGALHSLCSHLIQKYPMADIVFLTPLHRLSEETKINEIGLPNETNLSGYCDIIKEVCGYYGLPVLDLFHESGLQPAMDVIKEKYMPDGLHPSDLGHKRIAKKIMAYLKSNF